MIPVIVKKRSDDRSSFDNCRRSDVERAGYRNEWSAMANALAMLTAEFAMQTRGQKNR